MRTTVKTTKRVIASAAILMFFCLSSFAQQVSKSIPNSTSPDGIIGFLEFKPTDYGSQKHPLIIFLHGIGERGNGTSQLYLVANNGIPNYCAHGATMRFTAGGQTSSFVVLSPQLSSSYGYWPPFYLQEMIKYAKANLQIDPNRIYVTGLSLGGGGVWGAITDSYNPTFDAGIAAAAPVCGTQQMDDNAFCSTIGTNHLPLWALVCMDDAVVGPYPTQHGEADALACPISPAGKFTYYQSGGHSGAWLNAYDTGHITRNIVVNGVVSSYTFTTNLYEWFLSNTRGTTTTTTNTAPIANAGAAQIITLPLNTVTLTGTGTGTNGATIASYSWAKTSGPSAGTISLPLLNTTAVTGLVQGTYVFTLTVTDNHGLSSSSSVTITVNPLLNQTPVANAGGDVTITLPTNSVALDASASYDPDGSIAAYYWVQKSGPSTSSIADASAAKTTVSNLVQGVYVLTLQVRDNAGTIGYGTKTITVNAAPAAPAVVVNQTPISNAGADATITLPTNSVALDGSASYDPDGSIVAYYWVEKSGPSTYSIADVSAARTTLSNLVQGVYVFTLQVRDNAGVIGYSNKTITVNAAQTTTTTTTSGNQAPVANPGPGLNLSLPTNSTTLDASSSFDPDGSIAAYYWAQTSGPTMSSIGNAAAAKTTLGNLVQGIYVFTLQVKDNAGVVSSATKTIAVNAASTSSNQTPVSNGGADITISLPTNSVSLDGSASYDPDGSIVAYYWAKVSGPSGYTIGNVSAAKTTLSNLAQGVYIFTLQVRDNAGVIGYSNKTIYVNQPPVANPGADVSIGLPTTSVALDASGSYDPDGSIVAWYWMQKSGPSGFSIADVTSPKTTVNNLQAGTYVFTLQVRDNLGVSTFSNKTITVSSSSSARIAASAATDSLYGASARTIKDSVLAATALKPAKLVIYPNPVYSYANIELYSADNSVKTVSLYDLKGVLKAKYTWQTIPGNNTFSLKNVDGLTNGMYVIDIRDVNGKSNGTLKFVKVK